MSMNQISKLNAKFLNNMNVLLSQKSKKLKNLWVSHKSNAMSSTNSEPPSENF